MIGATENGNGDKTRLQTLHELDQTGCSYGRVTRERVDTVKESIAGLNAKLWVVMLMVFTQLLGALVYLLTHPSAVKAGW